MNNKFGISAEDWKKVEEIIKAIDVYAQLVESDLFVDCFYSNEKGEVVAQGKPKSGSLYKRNIVGEEVLPENEPMVFYTWESGIGMKDARAYTQEKRAVIQKTIPILGKNGRTIAVLIEEKDVTERVQKDKKMNDIVAATEQLFSGNREVADFDNIMIREAHHRIKNNLQMIISSMRMQKRRAIFDETKEILDENILRLNAFASMHEFMMASNGAKADIYLMIEQLLLAIENVSMSEGISSSHANSDYKIQYSVTGEHLEIEFEKAQAVIMIINELVMNSIKHAFKDSNGKIIIDLRCGNEMMQISVIDDGCGYGNDNLSQETNQNVRGLAIVRGLVKDKLNGEFMIEGGTLGTVASIRFKV